MNAGHIFPSFPQGAMFQIAGYCYTASEMLSGNAEDADVCEWIKTAQIGDIYPGGGEPCKRVA